MQDAAVVDAPHHRLGPSGRVWEGHSGEGQVFPNIAGRDVQAAHRVAVIFSFPVCDVHLLEILAKVGTVALRMLEPSPRSAGVDVDEAVAEPAGLPRVDAKVRLDLEDVVVVKPLAQVREGLRVRVALAGKKGAPMKSASHMMSTSSASPWKFWM